MWKISAFSLLGFALLLGTPPTLAARQTAETKAPPVEDQLKERVKALYRDILKDDRVAALDLVAPESKNQFLNNRYDGLADVHISSVEIAPSGERATVKVTRLIRVPTFTHALELNVIDTWQLLNGQWYYVLPPPGEVDTPFGKIKFDPNNKASDAEVQEMKQRIEKAYKNVDPDQYIQALQKAAGGAAADSKAGYKPAEEAAADSKADGKKPSPSTTAHPPGDSPKPQH